jgi:nucleotide-binding universal stress UspA family protein
MYRALMVPLDGSTFSRHAIPWALALARPETTVVHLVDVLRPDGVETPNALLVDPAIARDHRAVREAALSDLANRLSLGTGVSFRSAVEEGDAVHELIVYGVANAVEVIVMSTHGRGGFGRALLGSVSDGVIRRGTVPVLLVRPHRHDPEEHEPAGVSDVLVPLDGSAEGEQIIDQAIAISALTGAACVLLHVDVPVLVSGIATAGKLPDTWGVRVEEADAADYLARITDRFARIADRFVRHSIPVSTAFVHDVDAASGILAYCRSHPVSLIAMTTHGRGVLGQLLFGSVAEAVLHRAEVPVFLLRVAESARAKKAA